MDVQGLIDMLFTSTGPTTTAVSIPAFLELGAIVAGAVSGALDGCNKRLDMLGVCVLALITALGGGLLRDMILPTDYVYMLENPIAVILALVTGLAAFFFAGLFYKLDKPIAVFDIISVALFTCMGADKALMAGYGIISCVIIAAITGVGGGFIRDICLGRIPNIFKPSNYYAICSVVGGIVYYTLAECHMVKIAAAVVCVVVVVGLRWLSLRYNLITATAVDLTPKITGPISRMRHRHADSRAKAKASTTAEASTNAKTEENARSGVAEAKVGGTEGAAGRSGSDTAGGTTNGTAGAARNASGDECETGEPPASDSITSNDDEEPNEKPEFVSWSETGDLYDAERRKARELDEHADKLRGL